jgi:hypothetical protein
MRVSEEPVCNALFRQNQVFTSLHLKSPVHVVPPLEREAEMFENIKDYQGYLSNLTYPTY